LLLVSGGGGFLISVTALLSTAPLPFSGGGPIPTRTASTICLSSTLNFCDIIWITPSSRADALEILTLLLVEQMPMLLRQLDLIAALSGVHAKNVCASLCLLQIGTFGNSLVGAIDPFAHTDITLFD
jgi:hypothetical protein